VSGILGQVAPGAGGLVDIYTCPANTVASLRVIVTNRTAIADSFRVALALNGAADDLKQYVAYDKTISPTDTGSTIAFMISSGDVVRVRAGLGFCSFLATGETRDE